MPSLSSIKKKGLQQTPIADVSTRQPFVSSALSSPLICAVLQTLSHQYRFLLKTLLMLESPPVFEQVEGKKQKSHLVLYLGANRRVSPVARYISKWPSTLFCTTTGQIISKISNTRQTNHSGCSSLISKRRSLGILPFFFHLNTAG